MKKILTFSVAVLIILFTANSQSKIEKEFDGIAEIDMSVGSGDAIYEKSDDSKVYVTLVHTYGDSYEPVMEKRGDRLVIEERQGLKIGAIESSAYKMGFITKNQFKALTEPFLKSGYSTRLLEVLT